MLRRLRTAWRLYTALEAGDTDLLVRLFPFVKTAFTVTVTREVEVRVEVPVEVEVIVEVPVEVEATNIRKPASKPKLRLKPRNDEDDLRDALSVGFDRLSFTPPSSDADDPADD